MNQDAEDENDHEREVFIYYTRESIVIECELAIKTNTETILRRENSMRKQYIYKQGYCKGHPKANKAGVIAKHILLAEKVLGKYLPEGVEIHHYEDIKDNSKIVICQDKKYHCLLHIRTRAYKSCGNVNYRKCQFCKEYDDPKNMYVKQKRAGWSCWHRECINEYNRKRGDSLPSTHTE